MAIGNGCKKENGDVKLIEIRKFCAKNHLLLWTDKKLAKWNANKMFGCLVFIHAGIDGDE